MSNLTIDQILAERRQDESPEIYGVQKEASSQPSRSNRFSHEEVEKMASILSNADIQPEVISSNDFNERIAAALILSDSINTMYKEAAEVEIEVKTEGSSKKEEEEEEEEEKDEETKEAMAKVASVIIKADDAGHSPEDIYAFIEKKAAKAGMFSKGLQGLKSFFGSTAGKATVGTGALGASAFGGAEYGEHMTEEKVKKVLPKILQLGQAQGYRMGARKGFEVGAQATNDAWKNRLKNQFSNKG